MQLTRRYDEHARVQTNENEMNRNEAEKKLEHAGSKHEMVFFPFMSFIVILTFARQMYAHTGRAMQRNEKVERRKRANI